MPDNSFRKQPAFGTPKAYGPGNPLQTVFPEPLIFQRAPTALDTDYMIGQIWFDQPNEIFYQYAGAGTWQSIAAQGGAGSFSTLAVSGTSALTGTLTLSSNLILNGAASQIQVQGGAATDFIGTSTLVLGTVTILNTNIAAGDRIFLSRTAANASTTLGELSYTISAGVSFTVTSLILGTPGSPQTGDLSSFAYFIVREI